MKTLELEEDWIEYGSNICFLRLLKVFFLLSTLPVMIQTSEKSFNFAQKCYFHLKFQSLKVQSSLKSIFLLKTNRQNSAYKKPLISEL